MDGDLFIKKILEHDERLADIRTNMASKEDAGSILSSLEGMATIVKRIEEDHTFAIE